ncbi:MAG: hypothetical protein AAB354_12640 [candidate division KSB1 bacterium]
MFKRGHRLFASGAIGLFVIALMHSLGHFSPPPTDPALVAVLDAMNGSQLDMGLAQPSIMAIYNSLSLGMSFFLLLLGSIYLIVLRFGRENAGLMRAIKLANVIGVAALTAVFAYYRIPPPAITFAIVGLVFLLSFLFDKSRSRT